jgi:Kef-type K+ transport system membrane component KefB
MRRVFIYSVLLLSGMALSQWLPLADYHTYLHAITMICLSYIMVEVGLEFSAEEVNVRRYALDYVVAAGAATLPWLFAALYFHFALQSGWKQAMLVGLFAAPTSAGVLFTLLAAAGLASTWVFKKARVLAIFDDLHTVLLIIPIQAAYIGFTWRLGAVAMIYGALLVASFVWINRLHWPIGKSWLLLYGTLITIGCTMINKTFGIHLEVLLPAFALGCLVQHHAEIEEGDDPHSFLDQVIKGVFMVLVGCALPRIEPSAMPLTVMLGHVAVVTVLSNIGKCFPLLFYKAESSLRQRLALSLGMFPRGEVGAGVLLIALSQGISGLPVTVGSLSLALNLLLTGGFIKGVTALTKVEGKANG